jgi:hypothetical protein
MDSDPHQSYRLFGSSPTWSGNSCDRHPNIGFHPFPDAGGHLKCDLLAHRPMLVEVESSDLQQLSLHVVVVCYYSAKKNIARAGNARESLPQHPTRATFRDREREPLSAALDENHRRELGVVLALRVRANPALQFQNGGRHEGLRAIGGQTLRGDTQIHSVDAREIR